MKILFISQADLNKNQRRIYASDYQSRHVLKDDIIIIPRSGVIINSADGDALPLWK